MRAQAWCGRPSALRRSSALTLVLVAAGTADAAGQRRHVFLELNPIHGTLGYGWAKGATSFLGVDVGVGFPQIDQTLVPDESLIDFAHLGVFLRSQPNHNVSFDSRFKLGLAELRGCSGCAPGLMSAVSGGMFLGFEHVKIGARITTGVIKESGDAATFVMNFTPLALLFTYDWTHRSSPF